MSTHISVAGSFSGAGGRHDSTAAERDCKIVMFSRAE